MKNIILFLKNNSTKTNKVIVSVICLILVIVFILFLNNSEPDKKINQGLLSDWDIIEKTIMMYAVPEKISQSGDFRFYHTDRVGKRLEGDTWFWAIPQNLQDKVNIDQIYNMLLQYPQDVYEITGIKGEDDCSYYESGKSPKNCVQTILFERISRAVVEISTTTIGGGYTVEFAIDYADDEPEFDYSSRVNILRDGKVLFQTDDNHIAGYYIDEVGDWLRSADDVKKKALKDVTGDNVPELILSGYSGGAHCCSQNYVIKLSNPLSVLLDLDTGDYGISFVDLNNDGVMEIKTLDSIFSYWNTSFMASPAPDVVLSLQNGKYKADTTLMRKKAPTDIEIKKMADSVKSWSGASGPEVAWKYAIGLIYSGNINSARKYVDLAWRNEIDVEFKSKEDFWNKLKEQTMKSPYYSDLSKFFGL